MVIGFCQRNSTRQEGPRSGKKPHIRDVFIYSLTGDQVIFEPF